VKLNKKSDFFKPRTTGFLIFIYSLWIWNTRLRNENGFDDFNVFFDAGNRLLKNENIYGTPYFLNLFKYYYSVLFAYLMSIVQWVSIVKLKFIWFLFNYLFIVRILLILKKEIFQTFKYSNSLFAFFLLITGKIVLYNFLSNQLTILMTWIIMEAYLLIKKEHLTLAVILLSIGINIKLLPIAAVPWLIYICKKKLRFIVLLTVCSTVLILFPALFIGWEYNSMLTIEWLKTINPFSTVHIMQTNEGGMLDISSVCTKYLISEEVIGEKNINLMNLNTTQLMMVVNAIRIALLASVVYLAYRLKTSLLNITSSTLVLYAFMALIPLSFPHQRLYSYLLSMPLLATLIVLVSELGNKKDHLTLFILIIFSGLLVWVDFTGEYIIDLFNLYRITSFGMMGLFVFYIHFILKFRHIEAIQSVEKKSVY
jgi:hypothetical protein